MANERRWTSLVVASAVGVPALTLALYITGYFALSKVVVTEPRGETRIRFYRTEWLASLFRPAAKLEELTTSVPVHVISDEDVFN
jgi:hypothetical protein